MLIIDAHALHHALIQSQGKNDHAQPVMTANVNKHILTEITNFDVVSLSSHENKGRY